MPNDCFNYGAWRMKIRLMTSCNHIESLEPRLAPAGTVLLTTANGILTITGDTDDNSISITDNPSTQNWDIDDPLSGTTFKLNGVTQVGPFSVAAQTSIKAVLGDGSDRIDIIASAAPSGMNLTGALSISTGKGHDVVNLGNAAAQQLLVGGATTLDLGEGDDAVLVEGSAVFSGLVDIKAGAGNDAVEFVGFGLGGTEHTLLRGLNVDMGAGVDIFRVVSHLFDVQGTVNIKGAGQTGSTQTVSLSPDVGTIDGAASISFTAGNLAFTLTSDSTDEFTFGAGLTVTGAAGNDSLNISGSVEIVGALNVDFKDGTNAFLVNTNADLTAANFTLKGGTGTDSLSMADGSSLGLTGAFTLTLGAGDNVVLANLGTSIFATSLSLTTLGGADEFIFAGTDLFVPGAFSLNLGAGANEVDILASAGFSVGGNLAITTTTGLDVVNINCPEFFVAGSVSLNLGGGNNTTEITNSDIYVGGSFVYTGGAGNDEFTVNGGNLTVRRTLQLSSGDDGSNPFEITPNTGLFGSLIFTGGKDTDTFRLGDYLDTDTSTITIVGTAMINMGVDQNTCIIGDTTVRGAFTFNSTTPALLSDSLTFDESTLNGTVLVNMGAGGSIVSVEDSLFRGNVTINTGAGADLVSLDSQALTVSASSWLGVVRINTGAGIDTVNLGANPVVANASNLFYQKVYVDGGTEADTLVNGGNTFFAVGSPFLTSIA